MASDPHYLITEQDIHAYIDGELPPDRKRAVERFLAERELSLASAIEYLRNTFDLRSLKEELYQDTALRGEVAALLEKRRHKQDEASALSSRSKDAKS